MSRVLVIALDAVDSALIERRIAEGDLPHLARLRARAATVALRSPSPYRAEYPWTELMTGCRPDTLRYWSTVAFDPSAYDAYLQGAAAATPFFDFGDQASVVTLDLPKVVHPATARGLQVLGWGAHSPQHPLGSQPPGVLDDIAARFGAHPGFPLEYAGAWHQGAYLRRLGAAQAAAIRQRGAVLRWLAGRAPDWDLLMTLVGETHQVGHMTYHGVAGLLHESPSAPAARGALDEVLCAADELVGDLVSWAPADAAVVVCSVQGMTAADDDTAGSMIPEVLLRSFLDEARLPAVDLAPWLRRGAPPVIPGRAEVPASWFRAHLTGGPFTQSRHRLARLRRGLDRRAPRAVGLARRLRGRGDATTGPERPHEGSALPFHNPEMNAYHPATWYRDAWPRLPAFVVPGFSDVHVRINLAGRERDGSVERDDYARACRAVTGILEACRDPRTGLPVILDVTAMRADDPLAPDGPTADLVFRLRGTDALEHPDAGPVGPVVAQRTGGHTASGFAYVSGPGIVPGSRGEHPVRDLSATIAALVGAVPSAPLDGTPFLSPATHP